MNLDYMLNKISEASSYLTSLNTLINKKLYDDQEEFIKCLKGVQYDILTIESLIKQENIKNNMIIKLRNVCNLFNECGNCPLNKSKNSQCPVCDYMKLSKLKFEEIHEMYNCVEEWVKNFILDD